MPMTSELPQLRIRIEDDLKEKLKDAAWANRRSMNAEIIARLEASFESRPDPATTELLAEFGRWLADKKAPAARGE